MCVVCVVCVCMWCVCGVCVWCVCVCVVCVCVWCVSVCVVCIGVWCVFVCGVCIGVWCVSVCVVCRGVWCVWVCCVYRCVWCVSVCVVCNLGVCGVCLDEHYVTFFYEIVLLLIQGRCCRCLKFALLLIISYTYYKFVELHRDTYTSSHLFCIALNQVTLRRKFL